MTENWLDPLDFEDVVERRIAIATQSIFVLQVLKHQQGRCSISLSQPGVLMGAVGACLIFELAVFNRARDSRGLVSLWFGEAESAKAHLSFSVFVSALPSFCLTIRHSRLFFSLQCKCIINTELRCHGDHLLHRGVLWLDDHCG